MEEKYCPHCGQINKHAQQHIRDMERYQGEFEETKKEINSVSKSYSRITVRAIIIVILVVLLVVFMVLASEAYSLIRDWERNKSERNAKKYIEQIETYLAEEDYLTLAAFTEERNIRTYSYSDEESDYSAYFPIMRVCQTYDDVYYQIIGLGQKDGENLERAVESLGNSLEYFYQYTDPDYYPEHYMEFDAEKCKEPLETMVLYVEKLLQTYCNLSEEEAAELKEMSAAKRIVLIEERMGYAE